MWIPEPGERVRENQSSGYVFSGKELVYVMPMYSDKKMAVVHEVRKQGYETVPFDDYHLVPFEWLRPVQRTCSLCGQAIPDDPC